MTASDLERRVAELEAIVERQIEGPDTSGTSDSVSRRSLLHGLGLLGLGSYAIGSASADPQGQLGSPDRPVRTVYAQRLLENLFRNAIDHVGEDVTIETGLDKTTFYVADDGPGIPEADRDRIFEHGYTTEDEGTGLGLSIVEQLAEAHGWKVILDPDHDGARFVVSGCKTTLGSETVPAEA